MQEVLKRKQQSPQNIFAREYRNLVSEDSLAMMSDVAVQNLIVAFGQMNQTYYLLFQDVCTSLGTILAVKDELKLFQNEEIEREKSHTKKEKGYKEQIAQQDVYMQGLEKQLQVMRQRLSDSENNGSRDLNKYTEKQFHEQLELLQQEVKHLTTEREMNQEDKRRYNQLPPQHQAAVQQPLDETKASKIKIPSLLSKQVQKAATTTTVTALSEGGGEREDYQQDRTIIAEYSQHERPVIKKQAFNHINFAQQANSIAGPLTRNDYPNQLSRGNNNSNVSHAEAKLSDEEVFRQQRQLAEQRRQQQEAEMVKNQEYNSSLNYAKILAPHVRSNPADTSPKALASSLKSFNQENDKQSYQDISLKQYKMEVENSCFQEAGEEEITKPGSGGKKKFKKQNLKKVTALNDDQLMEPNSNEAEQSIADVLSNREVIPPSATSGHAREKKTINFLKARSMAAQFERDLSSESGSPIKRSGHQRSRSRSNENNIQAIVVQQSDKPPDSSSLLTSFEFKKKPAAGAAATAGSDPHQQKKIVVNPRTKEAREAMNGYGCGMCKEMYNLLGEDFCQKCSRHRYEQTPPHTPNAHYQNMSSDNEDEEKQLQK